MLHVSGKRKDAPTVAQLIEALQKLPRDMVCTRFYTESDPVVIEHIPHDRHTMRPFVIPERITRVEIVLEPR